MTINPKSKKRFLFLSLVFLVFFLILAYIFFPARYIEDNGQVITYLAYLRSLEEVNGVSYLTFDQAEITIDPDPYGEDILAGIKRLSLSARVDIEIIREGDLVDVDLREFSSWLSGSQSQKQLFKIYTIDNKEITYLQALK